MGREPALAVSSSPAAPTLALNQPAPDSRTIPLSSAASSD